MLIHSQVGTLWPKGLGGTAIGREIPSTKASFNGCRETGSDTDTEGHVVQQTTVRSIALLIRIE